MRCNGMDLYVQTQGDKGAPALLLMHGNGEDHTIFDEAIPLLAQRYFVIAPDSRGHGASQAVSRYDYTDMARDMAALLEQIGAKETTVFGFSDGGIVGLLMAIYFPQRMGRLVAAGANVKPWGVSAACYRQIGWEYMKTRDEKLRLMLTKPHIARAKLASIHMPTLILAGEHDLIRPAHTRRIALTIPGARLRIVAGEGHGSYIVHSARFISEAEL